MNPADPPSRPPPQLEAIYRPRSDRKMMTRRRELKAETEPERPPPPSRRRELTISHVSGALGVGTARSEPPSRKRSLMHCTLAGLAVEKDGVRRVRIERIAGHCTLAGLVFRHSLATCHACYRCSRAAHRRLWASARAEVTCVVQVGFR